MKRFSRPVRTPSVLSESIHHQLDLYTLAAGAAGVSVLALAQPSEARVVYTKAHKVIGWNGVYSLDLNHDGIVDFLIREASSDYQPVNGLFAKEAFGNAVLGFRGFVPWTNFASALKPGVRIGPVIGARQEFVSDGYLGEGMVSFFVTDGGSGTAGQWANVTNRYLGLRFKINGENHYGWARLSVKLSRPLITATLTGYAYETVANKSIRAGQIDENMDASNQHSSSLIRRSARTASLGMLALGAESMSLQRRQ